MTSTQENGCSVIIEATTPSGSAAIQFRCDRRTGQDGAKCIIREKRGEGWTSICRLRGTCQVREVAPRG